MSRKAEIAGALRAIGSRKFQTGGSPYEQKETITEVLNIFNFIINNKGGEKLVLTDTNFIEKNKLNLEKDVGVMAHLFQIEVYLRMKLTSVGYKNYKDSIVVPYKESYKFNTTSPLVYTDVE